MIQEVYDYYITPEEYEKAESNGISRNRLNDRVRGMGWNKEKAINTPLITRRKIDKKWIEIAESNGICLKTFQSRIFTYGWEIEKAATTPVMKRKKILDKARNLNRKFSDEILDMLKKNRINYNTFYMRVKRGWSIEKAINTPKMSKREVGLLTKDKQTKYLPSFKKISYS